MKLTHTLAALTATTLAGSAATIVVPNGDFEAGVENPIATNWDDTSGNARSFNQSGIRLIGDAASSDFVATHDGFSAIAANTQYTIGFDYGNAASGAGTVGQTGTWTVEFGTITGGTFTQLATTSVNHTIVTAADIFFNGSEQTGSFVFTTDGTFTGGETLSIRANNGTGGISFMGFDNFTVDGTAVPEPSSTALLGLGGLALILRRRK